MRERHRGINQKDEGRWRTDERRQMSREPPRGRRELVPQGRPGRPARAQKEQVTRLSVYQGAETRSRPGIGLTEMVEWGILARGEKATDVGLFRLVLDKSKPVGTERHDSGFSRSDNP